VTSELDLVQIGPDDVDPAVLTADGVEIAAVLARFTPVTRREVDLAALPPRGGARSQDSNCQGPWHASGSLLPIARIRRDGRSSRS
jgi:hypothetical protein